MCDNLDVSNTSITIEDINETDFNVSSLNQLPSLMIPSLILEKKLKSVRYCDKDDFSSNQLEATISVPNNLNDSEIINSIGYISGLSASWILNSIDKGLFTREEKEFFLALMDNQECNPPLTLSKVLKNVISEYAVLFNLAHEVGHIIDKETLMDLIPIYGEPNFCSVHKEYTADKIACEAFIKDIPYPKRILAIIGIFSSQFSLWFTKGVLKEPIKNNAAFVNLHPDKDDRLFALLDIVPESDAKYISEYIIDMAVRWIVEKKQIHIEITKCADIQLLKDCLKDIKLKE